MSAKMAASKNSPSGMTPSDILKGHFCDTVDSITNADRFANKLYQDGLITLHTKKDLDSVSGNYNKTDKLVTSVQTQLETDRGDHAQTLRTFCKVLRDLKDSQLTKLANSMLRQLEAVESVEQLSSQETKATDESSSSSSSSLTVDQLDQKLKDLVSWERFAIHLPEVKSSDIDKISKQVRGVDDQKTELYKLWLKKYKKASWSDVRSALKKIDENSLAEEI